jgi:hypothetical protein
MEWNECALCHILKIEEIQTGRRKLAQAKGWMMVNDWSFRNGQHKRLPAAQLFL